MTKRPYWLAAVLFAAPIAFAHDVVPLPGGAGAIPLGPPGPGVEGSAQWELFETPFPPGSGFVTVTGVTQTANGTVGCPGGASCTAQFNLIRGHKGVGPPAGSNNGNTAGILLTDFCGLDLGPHVFAYGACAATAAANGGIPSAATAGFCTGFDPVLDTALGGISGPTPYPNADSAILEVAFMASAAATIELSYSWGTYETPTDPSFANAFGIWLDGTLLAGGDSNSGPAGATDPWALTASDPGEFNNLPNAFWVIPPVDTGHRSLTLTLGAGAHTLRASVADHGPAITTGAPNCTAATPGACNIVGGFLTLGAKVHRAVSAGNPCGGLTINYQGHPSSGGAFADFRINVGGAPAGASGIVAFAADAAPMTGAAAIPLALPNPCGAATLDLLVNPVAAFFNAFSIGAGTGFPAAPVALPPGMTGAFWAQYWAFTAAAGFRNSNAIRVPIGPP